MGNFDLQNLVTPVKPDVLDRLLREADMDPQKTEFLVGGGFQNGFDLCYRGPQARQSKSHNLPFTVENSLVLCKKLMKEVQLRRVAGPFDEIPYDNFIQSLIGLVPKTKEHRPGGFSISLVTFQMAANQ